MPLDDCAGMEGVEVTVVDEWVNGKRVLVTYQDNFLSKKQEDRVFQFLVKTYKEGKFSNDLYSRDEKVST